MRVYEGILGSGRYFYLVTSLFFVTCGGSLMKRGSYDTVKKAQGDKRFYHGRRSGRLNRCNWLDSDQVFTATLVSSLRGPAGRYGLKPVLFVGKPEQEEATE